MMAKLKEKEFTSQAVSPPIVLSLDAHEQEMLETYLPEIKNSGMRSKISVAENI